MKRYIAYFDYLGYKEFIENNDLDRQKQVMDSIFREIEAALGQDYTIDVPRGVIADLSNSKINGINFSDTVVFFTNDSSKESLFELLEVAYKFNWRANGFIFPVRGALVYDELVYVDYKNENSHNGTYNINSVFGKGLVNAHLKAESQNWAGTVIENSFVEQIELIGLNHQEILSKYAKKYKVPYKTRPFYEKEYVLNYIEGQMNKEAFENYSKGLKRNFSEYKKTIDHPSVKIKLENTIEFLRSYLQ